MRPPDDEAAPALRPLPTADSLCATNITSCTDPAALTHDIARAAASVKRPLCGMSDVTSAFADALISAELTPEDLASVISVLVNAAVQVPAAELVEAVYSELCRRAVWSRCKAAVTCAVRLSASAMRSSGKSITLTGDLGVAARIRVLLYDLVYALGARFPNECLDLVAAAVYAFSCSTASAVLFPSLENSLAPDLLESSLLASLVEVSHASGASVETSNALMVLGSKWTDACSANNVCDANENESDRLKCHIAAVSGLDEHCAGLGLALEVRRMGSARSYEDLILLRLWPAIMSTGGAASVSDRAVCKSDDRKFAQLLSVLGLVLAAMEQDGDGRVRQAIACVETRLAGLLLSDELSDLSRCSVAKALLQSIQGPRNARNRIASSRKRTSAEYRNLLDVLSVWRQSARGADNIIARFLSASELNAIDKLSTR
jgi:hypothetical protein